MKKTSLKNLKRLLSYAMQDKILFLAALLFGFFEVISSLLIPFLAGKAIDMMGNASMTPVIIFLSLILLCAGIYAISLWISQKYNEKMALKITSKVRDEAFRNLQSLPIAFYDQHKEGDLISRLISDTDTMSEGLLLGFTQFFRGILTIVVTLVLLVCIHPVMAACVFLLTPLSLVAARLIAKSTSRLFKTRATVQADITSNLQETIHKEKIIKAYGFENHAEQNFNALNEQLRKTSLRATFASSLTNPTTRFINSLVYAVVALLGALILTDALSIQVGSALTVGVFSSCLHYASQYTKPFNEIASVVAELQNSLASAERVFEICDAQKELADYPDAVPMENAKGHLTFDHVTFGYLPEKIVLKDISFEMEEGTHVALVGETGSGKTTLIQLLLRFYEPNSGSILLDGQKIDHIKREDLRKSFGLILQDSYILTGSIRDNIVMGNPSITEEDIQNAVKKVHLDTFIEKLPQGYDTEISMDNSCFSKGQMQLLCLARVLASPKSILLLDEATSSLDTCTEKQIHEVIDSLIVDRTAFIVAHRLSTIQRADLILVMKNGEIVESGTHNDLLSKEGYYAELYHKQFMPLEEEESSTTFS